MFETVDFDAYADTVERLTNFDNLAQFEALITKYLSITIDDIKKDEPFISSKYSTLVMEYSTPHNLTGFGSKSSCMLCKSVRTCKNCIWEFFEEAYELSMPCAAHYTYDLILKAETPEQLLRAFHKRANYMISCLEANGIESNFYEFKVEWGFKK